MMPLGLNRLLLLTGLIGIASGLYRDGYEVIETGPGGFFGAVIDEASGTAWFGVDDSPARLVRLDLNTMEVTGKLELRADEQRLWCLVKHGKFGYMGVESPGGRLVGVDLEKMERLGYATASKFPLLAGTVIDNYGYFSAGSNPATIMRLHLLEMQAGHCEDWSQCRFEVALNEGEEAVRVMVPDAGNKHLILGMYTSPGRLVKIEIPSLKRVGELKLGPHQDKVLCGARYQDFGIFGTGSAPGMLTKVRLDTMTEVKSLQFIDGEDRPASIIVKDRYAFIGFGSAWAEGTTSVVKVDLDRMVRVAAIITRVGQTWLYTGLGYQDHVFFGTRGTASTKHAAVVRVNTNPTFPGVPVPPLYNTSGADWIQLNWLRDYPEYHTGGAPIIGARVLMRPSDHHDWTAEHVYGYAAPDPAAPKDRIVRVHESVSDLTAHGYVAKVDGLSPQSAYKFAVILTNEIGPSHRSRSSEEMKTGLSWELEGGWFMGSLIGPFVLVVLYGLAWRAAPRLDALYADNESEEEAGSSLLGAKGGAKSNFKPIARAPDASGLREGGLRSGGAQKVARKVTAALSAWLAEDGGGLRKVAGAVGVCSYAIRLCILATTCPLLT